MVKSMPGSGRGQIPLFGISYKENPGYFLYGGIIIS